MSDYLPVSYPYNSSMYRLSAANKKAMFYVQKFVSQELTPLYEVDEVTLTVSDNDESDDEGTPKTTPEPAPLFYKVKPATVHLTKPVIVEKSGKSYVAGVSGVKLKPEYLQQLLMKSTDSSLSPELSELNCGHTSELHCYLIDYTAHVLASNQQVRSIELGDFLGAADPQLMEQLVEVDQIFGEQIDLNYEALCPDPLDCCSFAMRSVIIPTINSIVFCIQNAFEIIRNLGYFIVR